MGPEGELRVGLRVSQGRIGSVRITSTRPDVARSLLQGRTRAEVAAAVPLLFSLCGHSQAAASELSCAAAAAAAEPAPDALLRCRSAVSAETVREYAWRTLLDWPQWIAEQPNDDAVAAARASLGFGLNAPAESGAALAFSLDTLAEPRASLAFSVDTPADPRASAIAQRIAIAAFGVAADEWLDWQSLPEFDRWLDAGPTAAARFVRQVRDDDASAGATREPTAPCAPLLDAQEHAACMLELARACDADPEFARHPTWRGAPAETGALARLRADPLIGALKRRSATRVPARFVARLRELALLLAGRAGAAVGAKNLRAGEGIGWVENARGLLIHQVRLVQDRVHTYRIIAPTEWNFHPAGALAMALTGSPAQERDGVKRFATRVVHSLDPCVACRVGFDDA